MSPFSDRLGGELQKRSVVKRCRTGYVPENDDLRSDSEFGACHVLDILDTRYQFYFVPNAQGVTGVGANILIVNQYRIQDCNVIIRRRLNDPRLLQCQCVPGVLPM